MVKLFNKCVECADSLLLGAECVEQYFQQLSTTPATVQHIIRHMSNMPKIRTFSAFLPHFCAHFREEAPILETGGSRLGCEGKNYVRNALTV